MNSEITLLELASLMAEATSTSQRVCELFLRELFATVSQSLIDGESVKIKGIGDFRVAKVKPRRTVNRKTGERKEVAGYSRITFIPDKSLAEAVNQSFAQFETVVLDEAVTDDALADIDKQYPSVFNEGQPTEDNGQAPAAARQEERVEPEPVKEEQTPEPEMVEETPAPEPETVAEPIVQPAASPVVEPSPELPARKPMLVGIPIDGPSQPVPEPVKDEEPEEDRHFYRPEPRNVYTPTPEQIEEASRKPNRRWIWVLAGLLVASALAWMLLRGHNDIQAEQHAQEVVQADTIVEVDDEADGKNIASTAKPQEEKKQEEAKPQEPKPQEAKQQEAKPQETPKETEAKAEPQEQPKAKAQSREVTDVVTSQIVLTTLSEKHYGSPWFWVYIYEENVKRGIINNPNNIRPGTRVVIPPADKYGINPNDKASLKKAQIKSMEYLKGR